MGAKLPEGMYPEDPQAKRQAVALESIAESLEAILLTLTSLEQDVHSLLEIEKRRGAE